MFDAFHFFGNGGAQERCWRLDLVGKWRMQLLNKKVFLEAKSLSFVVLELVFVLLLNEVTHWRVVVFKLCQVNG